MVIKISAKETLEGSSGEKNIQRPLKYLFGVIVGLVVALYYFIGIVRSNDIGISEFKIVSGSSNFSFGIAEENKQLNDLGLTVRKPVIIKDSNGKEKKLHGRFLHITDIHPDSYYKEGTSIDNKCHRGKPDGKKDKAPRFGMACAGCDAPVDLMEYTLKWIDENIRDEIDFVIWTGDNVRHDNDRQIPRTESEIFDMNEVLAQKMHALFRDKESDNPRDFDAIVVPSLGNNDVFPHNLFAMGPTLQTREYYRIWNLFVPQAQQRIFDRSSSFVTEVIPGKLAVVSINTLYLFKSNPLVDNCNSKKQPGYQLLVWFGNVLQEFRERGVKVWLSGHVPPIPKNYADSCYDKFTLWTYEYRDIIIGSVYGHMNMDHFIPADGKKAWKVIKEKENAVVPLSLQEEEDIYAYEHDDEDEDEDDIMWDYALSVSETHALGAKPVEKESYMKSVRDTFYQKVHDKLEDSVIEYIEKKGKKGKKSKKEKKGKKTLEEFSERFSIVNIAGSVIPTFNPSFRIWEYNLTGLEEDESVLKSKSWDSFFKNLEDTMDNDVEIDDKYGGLSIQAVTKVDKTIPKPKPRNLPLGPGHRPQLFSPTKFIQYYADLKQIDKDYKALIKDGKDPSEAAEAAFKYQVEYTSNDDPYPLDGLLVKDYIKLASELITNKEQWKKYMQRAFTLSGYKD